ncbi:hypothetical protein G6514_001992 [Epicoccum nigrum]|nr:hypothetical protein G6514_001992 [Epicoccum nigrum]
MPSAVSHSNWCTEFCTEVALAQYNEDIYSSICRCLFEQSGEVNTALLIKLSYDKDRTDKPIGSGVYIIMRYESDIIHSERLEDIVQSRNRDDTGKNPKKETRIKLSNLTPNDAGLLDLDDFVLDVTHKQLNDLVHEGQDWERSCKQLWNKKWQEVANQEVVSEVRGEALLPASPISEVMIEVPDGRDVDIAAISASESGDEITPWLSESSSDEGSTERKKCGTKVENGEYEDACGPSTSSAERVHERVVPVLTIRDEHLARLASNSNTPADGSSADGSSADGSQAEKQGQNITDAEQKWRETLEELDEMKPGVMRVKGKILSGALNELREQIYRLTKRDPLHGYSVKDFLDAAAGNVHGEAKSDKEGMVDDYADMHEVSEQYLTMHAVSNLDHL